jgi:hypothetical protein
MTAAHWKQELPGGKMKKASITLLALATALAMTPVAVADTFDFSFTDGAVTGSGTLTGTYEGVGNPWLITSGTGTFSDGDDAGAVALVANPNGTSSANTVDAITYDNLLDLFQISGSYLDAEGLLFQFGSDGDYLNIFLDYSLGGGSNYYGWYDMPQGNGDDGFNSATGSFSITSYDIPQDEIPPTPEPGSFVLLGTGFCALTGLMMRRRAQAASALSL